MRTTLSGYYRNQQIDQNKAAKELFDVTKQISSGQKIQYAYDSPSTFIDAVRLDNEVTTLTQVKQTAQSALQVSTNTDTTMNEMTKILDAMKVKLVNAANETNTQDSLNAIAAELRGLESNLIQLSNTSINGNYLFSGSEINTKPIDAEGVYQGNAEDLKAFIGSGVQQTYNINGADLFLGDEDGTKRKITMNTPLFNQTKLYPDVMVDPSIPRSTGDEEFITERSTIRDLMGDTNNVLNDNLGPAGEAQHHFYIRGTNHDGQAFKLTVSMRDDENVGDLITRIGEAYGNSSSSNLVNVNINNDGQIEIEDTRPGSSKLDFHMVANTNNDLTLANIDANGAALDVDDLNINNTPVKSFMRSDFTAFVSELRQRQDIYDPNVFSISGDFITKDGKKAIEATLLSDVLRSDVVNPGSIVFDGIDSNGAPVVASYDVTATSTMQDLIGAMNTAYDANISATAAGDLSFAMKDGKIVFSRQVGFAGAIDVRLLANDANAGAGNTVDGLPSDASVAFDESYFKKDGNRLLSNISQVVKSDNSYATGATRLVDVSSQVTLVGASSLNMSGIDLNGDRFDLSLDFNSPVTYDVSLNGGVAVTYNLYDADTTRTPTQPDMMTYQQLMDVLNTTLTGTVRSGNTPADYDNDIATANIRGNTYLDQQGQVVFEQKNTTDTKAQFTMTDASASDMTTAGSVLNFQSNNALEISDPKTNFFKQIDAIIASVEAGRIRADGTIGDPRNVGVQNSIQAIDDLSEHLFNQHSVAGVQSQTLQVTSDRTDMLIITTKTLRSEVIDVDFADAALRLKQVELNYQAMLSTVSKISQLSLVNYL